MLSFWPVVRGECEQHRLGRFAYARAMPNKVQQIAGALAGEMQRLHSQGLPISDHLTRAMEDVLFQLHMETNKADLAKYKGSEFDDERNEAMVGISQMAHDNAQQLSDPKQFAEIRSKLSQVYGF